MILERKNFMNFNKLGTNMKETLGEPNVKNLQEMTKIYQLGQAGANEIGTKLENLDSEFQTEYDHNPIHHIEERMKELQSLAKKVRRKGLALTAENIQQHIFDVAGLRVVTNYVDDIYLIEKLLINQSDVTLIKRKDYVQNPKPSGYRSLHLVVSVPVFQSHGVTDVNVEIQIRTIGMDMWASLEHKLRYKTDIEASEVAQYGDQLHGYADELAEIEQKMQEIYKHLNNFKYKA
ncbi:GTP pyrophosphokinase family protein [Pediococcus siamensis]|uniref:GTP pyrophosphokinase n=1 Tax=Pediococcus siamensis TaxID=381829 RepID=UPI0039A0BBCD